MKVTVILFASIIVSSCLAQEAILEPNLSFVQAAQIAQETLKGQKPGSGFYLREMRLTARPDKPKESFYEARFEPPDNSGHKIGEEARVVRYRVIVVDMEGKALFEDREFTPMVIRRKVVP